MGWVQDNFLSSFGALRSYADVATFDDYLNSQDGVVYPKICTDIPDDIRAEVLNSMGAIMGRRPTESIIFMRLSPQGVHAPHQAHSDQVMGKYSMMLYLNRKEDCRGGTALVRHRETGMSTADEALALGAIWERDTNRPQAWEVTQLVDMQPNRVFIFDAALMHRAEPIGGFGTTQPDARLVLTGFFS